MEKSTKMVEEITEKRKMTGKVKDDLIKNIFYNFLLAIGIIIYICSLNFSYVHFSEKSYNFLSLIFSLLAISLTIGMFEFAYRKDSGKFAIHGIEMLFFSVIVLYMPKMFTNLDKLYSQFFLLTPLYCAIYYVGKSIVMYKKTEKNYQNNLSDVKEILKEETNV